jgi:high affinity Mn2+ porin
MAENECPAVYRKADVTVMRLKHERVSARPLIPARRFSQLSDAARSARTHAVKSVTVKKLLCQSLAVIALASGEGARAADSLPAWYPKAPAKWPFVSPTRSGSDWTGFYVGAHAGVSGGHSAWSATQPGGAPDLSGSLNFFQPYNVFNGHGSHFAGLTGGYNYELRSGVVIGGEADLSFAGFLDASQSFSSPIIGAANYDDPVQMFGTVRGRVGYDANHWLYYVTGGLAWTYDQFTRTQIGANPATGAPDGTVESTFAGRVGWTVGAGIEAPIVPGWTGKIEYLYSQFGNTSVVFPQGGQTFVSDLSMHQVRLGLNYKLGEQLRPDWTKPMPPPLETDNWAIHGQTTFVSQFVPAFHAPYRGANSLDSNAGRETWDLTVYVGRRLWQGAEFWINPEIDQGFGLSNTLGVAGFTSGEAYKVGNSYPYFRIPRAFVRQTFDLSGETQKLESGINQFSGSQTANRVVVTVGKFSVSDIFDTISYAHDPRNDFLNWSLVDAGSWDYAADAWGYTYGAAVEWYQGNWTLRAGLFDLSIVPNSIELDHHFEQFQTVYELEHRHELMGQPGKLAVVGFLNRGRMGRYDDALAFAQQNGTTPNTADVRRYTSRGGVNVNFEQQVVPNVGVFARAGFAGGNVEPYEFTDIDQTASVGLSLAGKLWGRPDDNFGIAGVANGISSAHQAYFNAGGLGVLVGDGQLPHPGREQILETYYSLPLGAWRVTADYQFIVNPGYNRDRGPVSVIGARLRTQF